MKAYELSLDPEQLQDFLSAWETAADMESPDLDQFAAHLVKATEVLDRLAKAEAPKAKPQTFGPGLEAIVNLQGEYIFKSDDWSKQYPDCATVFDVLPQWHDQEVRRAFADLGHSKQERSRLIVCKGEADNSTSMLLLQKVNSGTGQAENKVYVRWLKSAWSPRLHDFFSDQYGLTLAELGVFELIVSGLSFGTIVERFGKSQETIKTQSKAIYAKLGVSGREAAVRFALHIQFLLPNDLPETVKEIEALKSEVIDVEGCQFGIVRKGQLSGTPFILLHGVVSGYEFGAHFEEQLRRANLCAICVERPGYGRSDNPASVHSILDEWLDKFPALLDALGLAECSFVTHASGGAYVAATLGRHPQHAPRGICISTSMPNFNGINDKRFPVSHRFLFWCMRKSPSSLAFYLKAYAAYLTRDQNYEKLVQRNYGTNPSDLAVLKDPENMRCAIAGYKLVERPKMMGLIGDLFNLWENMNRWRELTQAPHANVHLHHIWGSNDSMISFEASRDYCDSFSFTSWSVIQDGGHLLQFSHAEQLVQRIKKMVLNDPDWKTQ